MGKRSRSRCNAAGRDPALAAAGRPHPWCPPLLILAYRHARWNRTMLQCWRASGMSGPHDSHLLWGGRERRATRRPATRRYIVKIFSFKDTTNLPRGQAQGAHTQDAASSAAPCVCMTSSCALSPQMRPPWHNLVVAQLLTIIWRVALLPPSFIQHRCRNIFTTDITRASDQGLLAHPERGGPRR